MIGSHPHPDDYRFPGTRWSLRRRSFLRKVWLRALAPRAWFWIAASAAGFAYIALAVHVISGIGS